MLCLITTVSLIETNHFHVKVSNSIYCAKSTYVKKVQSKHKRCKKSKKKKKIVYTFKHQNIRALT